ncbi:hypothetical protein [Blastomonas sp. AAP53]|uniref:hypothetical protein n=1 Tax=Blastomonas sp. AAP53 TaxID=1248760 RepID=UPI00036EF958|nr:hypothetical protein [Blastomonas sp. AAP53]
MDKSTDTQRVSLKMPPELPERLDRAASRRGVSLQSLIKVWIGDKLDQLADLR